MLVFISTTVVCFCKIIRFIPTHIVLSIGLTITRSVLNCFKISIYQYIGYIIIYYVYFVKKTPFNLILMGKKKRKDFLVRYPSISCREHISYTTYFFCDLERIFKMMWKVWEIIFLSNIKSVLYYIKQNDMFSHCAWQEHLCDVCFNFS